MRLEEFFNFDAVGKKAKRTPEQQRARNKPRDVLGNRPAAREGPKANFTNKDTVRGYKYLMSDKVRTKDPDHAEEKKRFRKMYGVGTGPVGKLPENYNEDNTMELKKLFELAGVDVTTGKAKTLVEQYDEAEDSRRDYVWELASRVKGVPVYRGASDYDSRGELAYKMGDTIIYLDVSNTDTGDRAKVANYCYTEILQQLNGDQVAAKEITRLAVADTFLDPA